VGMVRTVDRANFLIHHLAELGVRKLIVRYTLSELSVNKKLRISADNFGVARHPPTIPDWTRSNLG
jgi:hypothetical protein